MVGSNKTKKIFDDGWHLDRRVPIALILTIMMQTSAGIWWAASITARVDNAERWINDNRIIQQRLERIETKQEYIISTIEKLDSKLDRQSSREKDR